MNPGECSPGSIEDGVLAEHAERARPTTGYRDVVT